MGIHYTDAGATDGENVTVVQSTACRTALVGVRDPALAIKAAHQLVSDGAQLIELFSGPRLPGGRPSHP